MVKTGLCQCAFMAEISLHIRHCLLARVMLYMRRWKEGGSLNAKAMQTDNRYMFHVVIVLVFLTF